MSIVRAINDLAGGSSTVQRKCPKNIKKVRKNKMMLKKLLIDLIPWIESDPEYVETKGTHSFEVVCCIPWDFGSLYDVHFKCEHCGGEEVVRGVKHIKLVETGIIDSKEEGEEDE